MWDAMPIDRYGVLKGQVVEVRRETTDSPHYQIHLRAGTQHYRAAVNIRSAQQPPDLLYLADDDLRHPVTALLGGLPDGFTEVDSRAGGLALDFIRGNLFDHQLMRVVPTVEPGPDNDLGEFIDHHVRRTMADERSRAYVFGQRWGPEPSTRDKIFGFLPGNGVHDVHMNQGNSGRFVADDGVWQDGALLLYLPEPDRWVAVFLAFQSQSWHTDDSTGHTIRQSVTREGAVRIVAALVNTVGPAPEHETVTLLNISPWPVDLDGWALLDRLDRRQPLIGVVEPGAAVRVGVVAPVQLGNGGGTLTLVDPAGLKVDGVAYTSDQARREGWTVVFS